MLKPWTDRRIADHGGARAAAQRRWGTPAAGWLDLSTGINPRPYPIPAMSGDVWTRLPDADLVAGTVAAARAAYGAPQAAGICLAPGSQALIQMLPWLVEPAEVAVVGLTYAEHARCWALAGHTVRPADTLSDAAAPVVVVVNPNNPDGHVIPPETLAALADTLAARDGLLVVDEAFADVCPEISVAARAGHPALVVLRSFGKFFGLAGVRLGIALSTPEMAARLDALLGPWATSGPALAVGQRALRDTDWITRTRHWLDAQAAALDGVLGAAGLEVVGGTSLFRLATHPDAAAITDRLGRAGILVRPFAAAPTWLRFGLPGDADGLRRLADALRMP